LRTPKGLSLATFCMIESATSAKFEILCDGPESGDEHEELALAKTAKSGKPNKACFEPARNVAAQVGRQHHEQVCWIKYVKNNYANVIPRIDKQESRLTISAHCRFVTVELVANYRASHRLTNYITSIGSSSSHRTGSVKNTVCLFARISTSSG